MGIVSKYLPQIFMFIHINYFYHSLSSLVKEVSFYSGQWWMKRLNWLEVPRISKRLLSAQSSFPKFFFLMFCDHLVVPQCFSTTFVTPSLKMWITGPFSPKPPSWDMVSPWFQAGLYSPLPQINVGLTYLWCHWITNLNLTDSKDKNLREKGLWMRILESAGNNSMLRKLY